MKIMFASLGAYGPASRRACGDSSRGVRDCPGELCLWLAASSDGRLPAGRVAAAELYAPPQGGGLLAAVLINPAPPTLRQTDGTAVPTIPMRSVAYNESSAGVPAWLTAARTRPRV